MNYELRRGPDEKQRIYGTLNWHIAKAMRDMLNSRQGYVFRDDYTQSPTTLVSDVLNAILTILSLGTLRVAGKRLEKLQNREIRTPSQLVKFRKLVNTMTKDWIGDFNRVITALYTKCSYLSISDTNLLVCHRSYDLTQFLTLTLLFLSQQFYYRRLSLLRLSRQY